MNAKTPIAYEVWEEFGKPGDEKSSRLLLRFTSRQKAYDYANKKTDTGTILNGVYEVYTIFKEIR